MRTIIAAVPDMFFASKIRAVAEHLGLNVTFIRNEEALRNASLKEKPDLILVDLQSNTPDPFKLAHTVRSSDVLKDVPLLGFYAHVLQQLQDEAKEAGYTYIMPRSAFANKLADVLSGKIAR